MCHFVDFSSFMGFCLISGSPRESPLPSYIILIFQNYLNAVLTQGNFTVGFSFIFLCEARKEDFVSLGFCQLRAPRCGRSSQGLEKQASEAHIQKANLVLPAGLGETWERPLWIPPGLPTSCFRRQWPWGSPVARGSGRLLRLILESVPSPQLLLENGSWNDTPEWFKLSATHSHENWLTSVKTPTSSFWNFSLWEKVRSLECSFLVHQLDSRSQLQALFPTSVGEEKPDVWKFELKIFILYQT